MKEAIENTHLNWSGLTGTQKFLAVMAVLASVLIVVYVLSAISSSAIEKTESGKSNQQLKEEEYESNGPVFIKGTADQVIEKFAKNTVKGEIESVRDLANENMQSVQESQIKILEAMENIKSKLDHLEVSDKALAEEIAREKVQRRQLVANLSDGLSGHGGGQGPISINVNGTYDDSFQGSIVQQEPRVVSAFDYMALRGRNQRAQVPVEQPHLTVEKNQAEKVTTAQTLTQIENDFKEKQEISTLSDIIPRGTIFSAKLLSGMDAQTFDGAKSEAFPALAVLVGKARAPNGRTFDLKGCHVHLGGWGSLSTERAYMRTTALSCYNDENTLLESTDIKAYATGVDGKHGVRGRVVTKDSELVLNSLIASLWSNILSTKDHLPHVAHIK